VIAEGARVALGDEIAERLGARLVLVLIGERPGLSSPDSLGAYLTYAPRRGLTDAERNCVSNIRAGGLDVEAAASKITWLVTKALAAGMSGVRLKDDSDKGGLLLSALGDSASQTSQKRKASLRGGNPRSRAP
jgi:ethanolamine ammonia-lyase small subunit